MNYISDLMKQLPYTKKHNLPQAYQLSDAFLKYKKTALSR